jgi:hypothetical protein
VSRRRALRRRARRALRWPVEAELGYARVAVGRARGPRQRREHGPHPRGHGPCARMAMGRARTVHLGRVWFRPSDTRISFSIF